MPKSKPALVPELRFPEFREAGPWEVKRLGELVETVTPPKKLQTSEYLPSGKFPIIDQSPSDVSGWTDDETAMVEADFPLVVFGDHTCAVKLADGPFAQGADGIKILSPTSEIEARFLFLSLQADPIEQKGYKRHFSTLKEKLVPFPRKDTGEQQKIADCLGSLDDLIRAEGERLEALKAHKKGLMQRLFPAPGDTTPRLRFPEFRDTGPWEVKRLGDVVTITGGGTPTRRVAKYWSGDIPWISSSDVSDETIHEFSITRRISAEAVSNSATKLVPENSILLLSRVGVGKLAVSRIPVCTSQDFTNLTPCEDDVLFLGYYLSAWANVLKSFSQGMAIQGFTKDHIENLDIPMPKASTGEQQKIADCLTALDDLIRAHGATIEALKTHKKGLTQKLFPREVG